MTFKQAFLGPAVPEIFIGNAKKFSSKKSKIENSNISFILFYFSLGGRINYLWPRETAHAVGDPYSL